MAFLEVVAYLVQIVAGLIASFVGIRKLIKSQENKGESDNEKRSDQHSEKRED